MRYLSILLLLMLATSCYAVFCPTSFKSVNYGDSVAQVIQTCGAPTTQKQYIKSNQPPPPQEWDYYISASTHSSLAQPTSKLAITFKDNVVININLAGRNLSSTNLCGNILSGSIVQIGDTMDSVKTACGRPDFINQSQPVEINNPANNIEVVELRYEGTPPITLIFENGVLTDEK